MTDSSLSNVKVAPYRSGWLEGGITLITMGCYIFVWFAMAARDCKRITGRPFTPILWFFVPIVCITIPFACHILLNTFRDIEEEHHLPTWSAAQNIAWNVMFTGAYIGAYVVGEVSENSALQIVLWAVSFVMFLVLHQRINRIRSQFKTEPMMQRFAGFNALEWVVGLLFLVFWGAMFWALEKLNVFNFGADTIEPGTEIVVPEVGVRFTLNQEGWEKVEIGTVTDGSADYELRGPTALNTMWYAVFTYDDDTNFSSVAQNRQSTFLEEMSGATCNAKRSLQSETLLMRSVVICENEQGGDKQLYMSYLIETESGMAEILAYMWVPTIKYMRYKKQFVEDAQGLIVDVE